MIGKAIATAVIGVFLTATASLAFAGGVGGLGLGGAPTSTLIPSPPRNVWATAGKGLATVRFEPPKTYGGSPVTGYTVTAYPGRIRVRGVGSPIVVRGLISGQSYRFTVNASNTIGTGLASEPSNCITAK